MTDYVLNPCRRSNEPGEHAGEPFRSHDAVSIQFGVKLEGDRLVEVRYQSSSCATLVAYAEVLSELVEGQVASEALRIGPESIVARLPGVPVYRQDRAVLVIHAFWSAVARAMEAKEKEETS